MKKLLYATLILTLVLALVSCGTSKDVEKLCANSWESPVDILTFTEKGRVLHNFESEEESVSYYKLSNGKITMYTEEGEEFGFVFDYSFDGDDFILGDVRYTPVKNNSAQGAAGNAPTHVGGAE